MAPRKKGRGKATGAMLEKLQKKGQIAVQGDFELDWHRHEDQACIKARMAYSFRSIKFHLHKLYKSYATKEEARAHPPEEVAMPIWEKCCDLWETEAYKIEEDKNMIEFYKRTRTRANSSWWVTPACEELYCID
ncbi:hypothetical protein CJ030_MR7G012955 [Morella rubra]|uniref:Uncharacterized protein n=1 Tax=Morella rubra TaxID=262757 RepID=A0A6A1V8H5_9ROSI|nr:hypothetical protein CJ030_MR7G012955 [Morella rubra]